MNTLKYFLRRYFMFYIPYLITMLVVIDKDHYWEYTLPMPLTFVACECPEGKTPASGSDTLYLNIESIAPNPYDGDSLFVTVKAAVWSGNPEVQIEIYMLNGVLVCGLDSCFAYRSAWQSVVNNDPYTFGLYPPLDFLRKSPYHDYRVSAYLRGTDLYKSQTFYWGDTLPNVDVYLGRYRMWSAETQEITDAINCVTNSFNNSDPDTNDVHVVPHYSGAPDWVRDEEFETVGPQDMNYVCDTFARNHHSLSDTFSIIFALDHDHSFNWAGLSMSSKFYPPPYQFINWSFIFMDYIEWVSFQNGWTEQSVHNQVSVHELLHQLGSIDTSGHSNHGGSNANRCALWLSNHFSSSGEFGTLTSFYRVCDNHVSDLRSNLRGSLIASGNAGHNIVLPFPVRLSSQKYTITMSVSKRIYKRYEPVTAKFELINNNDEPMKIYDLFDPFNDEGHIKILDNKGHVWSAVKSWVNIVRLNEPTYVVQPGDTFVASMPINTWCELLKDYPLFDQWGYFPSGRTYRAYYYFNSEDSLIYGATLRSNEVVFEVTELEQEDKNLVDLERQCFGVITFDSAATVASFRYPDNPLTEYIIAKGIRNKHGWVLSKKKYTGASQLMKDYQDFFDKYPNTYYIYDDRFMAPLYFKLFGDGEVDHGVLADLRERNRDNSLSRFLGSRNIDDRIKSILTRFERKRKR
jgi:hypothetical protein